MMPVGNDCADDNDRHWDEDNICALPPSSLLQVSVSVVSVIPGCLTNS